MKAKTRAALGQFQIHKPPYAKPQSELIAWTTLCHQVARPDSAEMIGKLFRRYGISSEKIQSRAFECPDIETDIGWDQNKIYRFTEHAEGVQIRERAEFFAERALAVFENFYPAKASLPEHLIHVTCTGYVSPSAAQRRVAGHTQTAVTHAYHMGCYASLPAVRMAEAFVQAAESPISADIVHTEMCGLHMNAADNTPEQIVVQTLFADGHVKYSVKPESELKTGLRILAIHEEIIPGTETEMSWIPAPWGLQMTLSRTVPEKIGSSLRGFLQQLLDKENLSIAEILKHAIFAIHPGGPKIIESVRATLEISETQTVASDKILRERGNMSSATLPHVWDEILKSNPAPGTKVVSLAFGPGLTVFGAVFECF